MGAKGIHVFSTCTSEKDIVSLPFSLVKFVRVNGNASSVLDFTDSFALFVFKKKNFINSTQQILMDKILQGR